MLPAEASTGLKLLEKFQIKLSKPVIAKPPTPAIADSAALPAIADVAAPVPPSRSTSPLPPPSAPVVAQTPASSEPQLSIAAQIAKDIAEQQDCIIADRKAHAKVRIKSGVDR